MLKASAPRKIRFAVRRRESKGAEPDWAQTTASLVAVVVISVDN
jgi:hypothetical protein